MKVSLLNRLNMEQIQKEIDIFQKKSDPKSLVKRYLEKNIGDYQKDFENIERNTLSNSFTEREEYEKKEKITRNNKKNETVSSKKLEIMKEMMPETVFLRKRRTKQRMLGN